jgi:hypothetical protein
MLGDGRPHDQLRKSWGMTPQPTARTLQRFDLCPELQIAVPCAATVGYLSRRTWRVDYHAGGYASAVTARLSVKKLGQEAIDQFTTERNGTRGLTQIGVGPVVDPQ